MIKESFGIADTVEEAKEIAAENLGAGADADISFEIIDMPRKKLLGMFGGSKAKVRAYIEIKEKESKKLKTPKSEKTHTNKKENKEKQNKTSNVKNIKNSDIKENKEPAGYENAVDYKEVDPASPAGKAANYLLNVLNGLGCSELSVKVALGDNSCKIALTGEGLGACIGRRGETLDALQYLCSMSASVGSYYRVTLDIGNYREKRKKTLISLANRISAQVLRTGKSRSLEPMNPYERRIIHTAIGEIEGVSSNSVGEGNRRHIVISPDGKKPLAKAENVLKEKRTDSDNLPLYGKIK